MSINATDVPMIGERGSSSCARVISLLLSSIYQRQYIESARRLPGVAPLSPLQIQALDLFDELANDPVLNLMVGPPSARRLPEVYASGSVRLRQQGSSRLDFPTFCYAEEDHHPFLDCL
jgi:hypothetical protein